MKAIYYITLATVLFFTGCEFFSNNQELINPPEFEYLIQDLDTFQELSSTFREFTQETWKLYSLKRGLKSISNSAKGEQA